MSKFGYSLLLLVLITARPAKAQFGVPQIVYDPVACVRILQQLGIDTKALANGLQILQQAQQAYMQMQYNATNLHGIGARYRSAWANWRTYTAPNTYGNTGTWSQAANNGDPGMSQTGYQQATIPLEQLTINGPPDMVQRLQSKYASVNLADGAIPNSLSVIGQVRGNGMTNDQQLNNIENDSLSDDPNLNSEVGVLNKINAVNVVHARMLHDSLKLQTAQAELQNIQLKQWRDGQVEAINTQVAKQQDGGQVTQQGVSGGGAAFNSFDIP